MNLKTRDLYAFLEVCRLKSIRRSAESLALSQPALTKIIQQLERHMGVPLIERLPRGVQPTIYGNTLARYARFALAELDQAKETIDSIMGGKLGRVRIGANATAAHMLLPPIIERIRALNPFVELRVLESTIESLELRLLNGELDVVFAPIPRNGIDSDILTKRLLDDQLVVIAGDQNDLARQAAPKLADALSHPWIFVGDDPIKQSQIIPLLHMLGLPAPHWVMETNSVAFLMRFLRGSNCLSYQSRRLVNTFAGDGISIIALPQLSLDWPMMVSIRKNALLTPLVELIVEEAERIAKELVLLD